VSFEVTTGKPAVEILRLATERPTDVVVMGTHGLTGIRKLFFGSTTERVLRETTVPVLLTPASGRAPAQFEDIRLSIRRVLVPVDLTPAASDLVGIARRVAETLDVPLLLAHVVEPMRVPVAGLPHLPNIDVERRARAEKALAEFVATIPDGLRPEGLVAYGDPAEEITKLARDRNAGLIVIALHASPLVGPRMGSVTYRVMCMTSALVLAMPVETL
jgi:nucleotide-binding universal stress UspA family protein